MTVQFEFEKDTKNTIRFKEVLDGPLAVAKVGTLYVPKSTLATLGYKEGQKLDITLAIR